MNDLFLEEVETAPTLDFLLGGEQGVQLLENIVNVVVPLHPAIFGATNLDGIELNGAGVAIVLAMLLNVDVNLLAAAAPGQRVGESVFLVVLAGIRERLLDSLEKFFGNFLVLVVHICF